MKPTLSFAISLAISGTVQACGPLNARDVSLDNRAVERQAMIRRGDIAPPTTKTKITNVHIFNGRIFTAPGEVMIDGDTISWNGGGADTVVDAKGGYLIPGLMDSHLHANDLANLETLSSYGVTTAFNMACYSWPMCNALMNQTGLTTIYTAGFPAVGPGSDHARQHNLTDSETIHNPSQAQEWVTWTFNNGSNYMKITAETNGPDQDTQNALVQDVHKLGQKSMTHASMLTSYGQAVDSQTDGIQHTMSDSLMPDSMIDQIVAQKQFITPTMITFNLTLDNPEAMEALQGTPNVNQSYTNVESNVRAMHKAGIPILVGTDSIGVQPPFDLPFGVTVHWEMQKFVEAGFTPLEALRAATIVPSIYHDVPDRGVIAPGKRADLVLLNSNPLVNISNTLDIAKVWIGGLEYANVTSSS